MEAVLFGILIIVMIAFFGIRRVLFGDHKLLKGREGIQELLTGTVQKSMLTQGSAFKNKIGEVYTVLKPSGKIMIDDEQYEATTAGEYIDKGEKVKVIGKGLSNVLKVRKAKPEEIETSNENQLNEND